MSQNWQAQAFIFVSLAFSSQIALDCHFIRGWKTGATLFGASDLSCLYHMCIYICLDHTIISSLFDDHFTRNPYSVWGTDRHTLNRCLHNS